MKICISKGGVTLSDIHEDRLKFLLCKQKSDRLLFVWNLCNLYSFTLTDTDFCLYFLPGVLLFSLQNSACDKMEDCDVAAMAAAVFLISKPTKKVNKIVRRYHVRPTTKAREIYSSEDLLRDFRLDDTHPVTKEVTVCGYFKKFPWDLS